MRALAVLGLLLAASDASAQQNPFATVKRLSCTFSAMATAAWKGSATEGNVKPATLAMTFDQIDTDEGTAQFTGPFFASEINVRLSASQLHFLQSLSDGRLYLTTVFAKDTGGGRLLAVHSRHEYTEASVPGFGAQPEQYYGSCLAE